jgi:hypothetical protein
MCASLHGPPIGRRRLRPRSLPTAAVLIRSIGTCGPCAESRLREAL